MSCSVKAGLRQKIIGSKMGMQRGVPYFVTPALFSTSSCSGRWYVCSYENERLTVALLLEGILGIPSAPDTINFINSFF